MFCKLTKEKFARDILDVRKWLSTMPEEIVM